MPIDSLRRPPRARSIVATIVSVLLGLTFFGIGLGKLTSQPMFVSEFAILGLPLWFMFVTGAIEVAAAVLIVVPRTSIIGAALIVCVMIGAIIAHLTHAQALMALGPCLFLVLAAVVLFARGAFSTSLTPSPVKGFPSS